MLPITIELAIKVCEKDAVREKDILHGFSWNHFYSVCPEIKKPISRFEDLEIAHNAHWLNMVPDWFKKHLEEIKNRTLIA